MGEDKIVRPPRIASRFLEWYCRPQLLEDLQGDLHEFFLRNVESKGLKKAKLIYMLDVLKFCRLYTIRKPNLSNTLYPSNMIRSYIKTSGRSIIRHRLFAAINITGLAISMCVGLLAISFLSDINSYDQFQEKRDRIYRITTTVNSAGQPAMTLASSSLSAGRKIQQTIPGIESSVFLQRGFGGDVTTGETTVPLGGLWAGSKFFNVFTFPLVKGNPATALEKPYSLVLTEKSAKKLFGNSEALGRIVKMDTVSYLVTGIARDIPKLSHIQFEALVSFATIEQTGSNTDGNLLDWENFYSNYTYLVLNKKLGIAKVQEGIDKFSAIENANIKNRKISINLQPLANITVGPGLVNEIGPSINKVSIYILGALALIVVFSACFNYTNLSIARSLSRSREVGIRKVIGALKSHVIGQFITESILISLLALLIAFVLFLSLRTPFLSLHSFVQNLVSLQLSPALIIYFVLFAVVTGFMAGLLPAIFYARISAIQVLKNVGALKVFRHLNLRKTLIVIQYTFSLIFITTTVIGYNQYKSFLTYDLGFSTQNILNINMHGNKSDLFMKELSALPAVKEISKSTIITSLGSIYSTQMKYNNPQDSSQVQQNFVDEHYLTVHKYKLLAGQNFGTRPVKGQETEALVNVQLLKRFNIGHGNPGKAIGEIVNIDKKRLAIVGVLKDFHYGTLMDKIEPVILRYAGDDSPGYLNVKIETPDLTAAMASIGEVWRNLDKIHPLDAKFYDDQIEEAYSQFSVMIRIIGFFAVLAVVIASMGLFGMVVYTTEKRLKEISIRKVMGAGEGSLIYLMSKGFLFLLIFSAAIAIPATWLFFQEVILPKFAYHQPLSLMDAVLGFLIVMLFAGSMIGLQTLKVARSNPARVLKRD